MLKDFAVLSGLSFVALALIGGHADPPGNDKARAIRMFFISFAMFLMVAGPAFGQVLTKAQVSEKIKNVENGTDEFIEYLENKGDSARDRASSLEGQDRRKRRQESIGTPTESQIDRARAGKDDLEEAVEDLEKATDRLRRRFKRVSNYMDTRNQVENVLDQGREINQLVLRGNYGSEVARVWAALRAAINDLARIYGLTPMAV